MCYSHESAAESLVLALSQYSDHDMGPGNAGKEMVPNITHYSSFHFIFHYPNIALYNPL